MSRSGTADAHKYTEQQQKRKGDCYHTASDFRGQHVGKHMPHTPHTHMHTRTHASATTKQMRLKIHVCFKTRLLVLSKQFPLILRRFVSVHVSVCMRKCMCWKIRLQLCDSLLVFSFSHTWLFTIFYTCSFKRASFAFAFHFHFNLIFVSFAIAACARFQLNFIFSIFFHSLFS